MAVVEQKNILNNLIDKELDMAFHRHIIHKVIISKDEMVIELYKTRIKNAIECLIYKTCLPEEKECDIQELITIRKKISVSGVTSNGSKLIIGETNEPRFNQPLIQAIVKSFYYSQLAKDGKMTQEAKPSSYIKRIMQLRFLPPKLIEDILNGVQPADLTIVKLFKMTAT